MVAAWHQRARDVDAMVDQVWGEPVELIPWSASEFGEGSPDDSRTGTTSVGVLLSAEVSANDLAGSAGGASQASSDVVISIRKEPLLACGLKRGDRLRLSDRDSLYEVGFFDIGEPTGRPRVHCVRLRGL